MAVICPTVTATSVGEFRDQMERLEPFVQRVHLDFMDGDLAPTKSPPIEQAWWPLGVVADLHIMFRKPLEQLETVISLNPSLVIVHAEADGVADFIRELDGLGIRQGLALLQPSQPADFKDLIETVDHVLVFSGNLGHFGGTVDLALLEKVKQLKQLKPELEIGWDGGINADNARALADGGVDVLNTGGFIQKAPDPQAAYDTLVATLEG